AALDVDAAVGGDGETLAVVVGETGGVDETHGRGGAGGRALQVDIEQAVEVEGAGAFEGGFEGADVEVDHLHVFALAVVVDLGRAGDRVVEDVGGGRGAVDDLGERNRAVGFDGHDQAGFVIGAANGDGGIVGGA